MTKKPDSPVVPQARIERGILVVRGRKAMLDVELAELYGVPTKALNQAVKRNAARFPEDFMFRLTPEEYDALIRLGCEGDSPNRSQFVTGSQRHRDARFLPNASTEHGAIMAANVLNSDRAVEMSVYIVRTFVRLREAALQYEEFARRLHDIERRVARHDVHLAGIVRKLREMAESPEPKKLPQIGFVVPQEETQ